MFAEIADFPSIGHRGRGINKLGQKQFRSEDVERNRQIYLNTCFLCFDVLKCGRVHSGVVWGGLALMTGATQLSKTKFILGMYDTDRWVMYCSVKGYILILSKYIYI